MEAPLVSVLMAAYNSEKYVAEAIESVLASSYTNFELIICDDVSTDQTATIAKRYESTDSRVKVFVNETNLGDYPNRNRVASYATGKYLKYLDHDDVIYPWGLEVMVMCMEKYPEAGFGLMSYGLPQTAIYPILVSPAEAYRIYFTTNALFSVGPTGAIMRKDAFEAVNGFSGKPFVGDQEIWLSMSRLFPLVRMPWDLVWYRDHPDQESKRERKDDLSQVRRFIVVRGALDHPDCPLTPAERTILLRNYSNLTIRNVIAKNIRNLKIKEIARLFKYCGFTMSDVVKALKKSKPLSN